MSERTQQYTRLEREVRELREQGATSLREVPHLSHMDKLWADMTPQERKEVNDDG